MTGQATDMAGMVAGLGSQLRWATELEVDRLERPPAVVVAGMGGSGISGDMAAPLADEAGSLLVVHKGYGLPGWAGKVKPLVVAVSYSGATEETLSGVESARTDGLPVVAVTSGGRLGDEAAAEGWPRITVPGGLPPRAALGYLAGAVLRVLEAAQVVAPMRAPLDEAADVVDDLIGGGAATSLADDLAEGLAGRFSVVYGSSGPSLPAAQRWKTQLNENAKAAAAWGIIPELDHNEIVGWDADPDLSRRRVGIVALRDRGEHPQVARRFEITRRLCTNRVGWVGEVWSQGSSSLARCLSLVAVGDLVSLGVAERAGVDPMDIAILDQLKREMAE